MNELAKLIGTVVSIFFLIGFLSAYLSLMDTVVRIQQGDSNASQEFVELIEDEVVSTVNLGVVKAVAIAFASALGLGSLVALIKKI